MIDKVQRVLLVDDDRVFADLLTKQLVARGAEVVSCGTGQGALDALEKDGNFNVILLDISLPDIDGFEVLSRIESTPPLATIPVIIISNFAVPQDIKWGGKLGVRQFVTKASVMPQDIVDIALTACTPKT